MAYTGQPVPSPVHNIGYGKISDGKSVKVTVPEKTMIEAGKFYLLDGFLGCAVQSVTTGADETAEVVLSIEPAEYETDQTKEDDRTSMTKGTDIYWDKNNEYFTVSSTDIYAGKITDAADKNGVIWFKLAERPFAVDDVTDLAVSVGDLGDLDTTDTTSIVDAINEVNGNVGDLSTLDTTEKSSLVGAINEVNAKVAENVAKIDDPSSTTIGAVATALNDVIDKLVAAGLMESSS